MTGLMRGGRKIDVDRVLENLNILSAKSDSAVKRTEGVRASHEHDSQFNPPLS